MARTIEAIYEDIITEKETKATLSTLLPTGTDLDDVLNDLSSGSKVATWRLWAYVSAYTTWITENLFDLFKQEVEIIKSQSIYGTESWWIDRMFEFQLGDNLEIIEVNGISVIGYPIIDESKQIIKASAIKSVGGVSTIKLAKETAGELVALDTPEVTALLSYKDKIQPAGVKVVIVSFNSDLAKVFGDIYFNALLDQSIVQNDVELAITDYLSNIEFGGIINLNKLIDEVQKVDGVNDINVTNIEAKPNGGVYSSFDREYETSAGYVKIDDTFPLSATLNYNPQ